MLGHEQQIQGTNITSALSERVLDMARRAAIFAAVPALGRLEQARSKATSSLVKRRVSWIDEQEEE